MESPQVHTPEGLNKFDVTSESWREYIFADGFTYKIENPVTLYVKRKAEGDSHRVVDRAGVTHYVPMGWRALRWVASPEVEF